MSTLLALLRQRAAAAPAQPALVDGIRQLDLAGLLAAADALAAALRAAGVRTLGLYADNGIDWVIADLAALAAGICCVPLPRFFSSGQLRHAVADSGIDAVLADDPRLPLELGLSAHPAALACGSLRLLAVPAPGAATLPPGTAKITYTSGTTGAPKGVCLSAASQLAVAAALAEASGAHANDRHLCVLPLSTLLENVGGIYAPLLAGATVVLLPQAAVGLHGAAEADPRRLLAALHEQRASSAILVPQLLLALVLLGEHGLPLPPTLRFVAVGGAPVAAQLLHRAARLGLPVHEGYGLSEAASVVALNRPGEATPGSVGRPLPHVQLRIAEDGEVLVRGNTFLGYVGGPPQRPEDWLATGDLGHFDAAGRLLLSGRKSSVYSTAYGRNVAPEWVECELTRQPGVAQAAVFGAARPWNVAVLDPRPWPGRSAAEMEALASAAVAAANAGLPDYARVRRWLLAEAPFSAANGLLTSNGRVRRAAIAAHYAQAIENLYQETAA